MRVPRKAPGLVLLAIAAVLAAALVVAGCGGGSSSGGGEPASLAPAGSALYIEVNLAPEAKASEEINELAQKVAGIENVGEFVAEKLENRAAADNEPFDFSKEIEPWLGEKAGLYLKEVHGDNFTGGGFAIESTNTGVTEEFLKKNGEEGEEKDEEGEFEGHPYWVEPENHSVVGVIGDYLAYGESKAYFEEMVELSEGGEGLSESEKFDKAMKAAPEEGVGRVYVDLGRAIEESKNLSQEAKTFFELIGIEPKNSTLVGTVIPHAEQAELDVTTNIGKAPAGGSGDATKLLESLPATAVAGFASAEFGKSVGEGIDKLSEEGIPGQIEPGELKPALETVGINLDAIFGSIGNVGGFVEGSAVGNLGGAAVIETDNANEAKNTVANVGLLLRASGTKGVTAISGNLSGFSVHSDELGPKPLIVGATGEKIVIAYGPKAAAQALRSGGKTLGSVAGFQAGKETLGATPMSAFIAGGPGLRLVEALLSPEERAEIAGARPYLRKIEYVAIGSEAKGQTTTARVIVGL